MNNADELGRAVSAALGDGPSNQRLRAQRAALLAASPGRAPSPIRGLLWVSSLAFVVAIVAFSLRQLNGGRRQATPSWVEARPLLSAGAYLEAPGERAVSVRIREHVELELHPGSKLLVRAQSSGGADLALVHGEVSVRAPESEPFVWSVQLGELSSSMAYGQAKFAWDIGQASATIRVTDGVVECSSALGDWQSLQLRAGGRIEARKANVRARVAESAKFIELAPRTDETVAPRGHDQSPPPKRERARRVRSAKLDWRAHFEGGQYKEAMRLAKQAGWRSLVQGANAEQLRELADLARHSGDGGRAKLALRTLQKRFPTSRAGRAVDFLLGRIAMDIEHDYARAAKFFAKYVRENPRGRLRREAQGRILDAYVKLGDRKSASRAARDYLKHYPSGPYAGLARTYSRPD